MSTPLIVYALPRSRTYWLSRFLSYGAYACAHDQMRHLRAPEDVRSWLAQDFTGTAETAAAPWWRLVQHHRPDIRVLVVRRPVADVMASLVRAGAAQPGDTAMMGMLARHDRRLDAIEREGTNVLSVGFGDLDDPAVIERVFTHCLPYPFDPGWWHLAQQVNAQARLDASARYCQAHARQMGHAVTLCRRHLRGVLSAQAAPIAGEDDGVTIAAEPFETFWRDGHALFAAHTAEIGPRDGMHLNLNLPVMRKLDAAGSLQIVTARCNGRLFGYLSTIVSPSLESASMTTAAQTSFYVSPDFRGLGTRIQRHSIACLQARGVGEVVLKTGTRGDGARLGTLFRRLGAIETGRLFTLTLEAA